MQIQIKQKPIRLRSESTKKKLHKPAWSRVCQVSWLLHPKASIAIPVPVAPQHLLCFPSTDFNMEQVYVHPKQHH